MKSILFLGGVFPKNSEVINQKSKGNIQNAANVFQWNIIDGLKQNITDDTELSVLSAPFVGSWPRRFSDFFINDKTLEAESGVEYIPFTNLTFYKNISRYFHISRCLKKWCKLHSDSDISIVVYSVHTPFIKAIKKIKKKYNCKVHLVVPDLPEYMNLSERVSKIYMLLKKWDIGVITKNIDCVDSFTFLTKYMNEKLNKYNRPYVIVEGMVNYEAGVSKGATQKQDVCVKKEQNVTENVLGMKSVVYTGGMGLKYGIPELLAASEYFDKDIELILCGTGDAEELIKQYAQKNNNIRYMGQVQHKIALKYQKNATVLTNPRTNNEEYTKYSFPSKNLEYMTWNKPVVTFKLDGI